METLIKAIIDGGPAFYLAAASILLNVAQAGAIWKLVNIIINLAKEAVVSLHISTRAVEASDEERGEIANLMKEHQTALMIILGKIESTLAYVRIGRGGD